MIYLPSTLGRWWQVDGDPNEPAKYFKRIGWWRDSLRQMTFEEYIICNNYLFMYAFREAVPMEQQILDVLSRNSWRQSTIDRLVAVQTNVFGVKPDCTVDTALKRLLKKGKVTRVLNSRGWFQWYVYSLVKAEQ